MSGLRGGRRCHSQPGTGLRLGHEVLGLAQDDAGVTGTVGYWNRSVLAISLLVAAATLVIVRM